MNWGKGIALVYIAFGLGMAFMVYKTTQKKSEMVTENYYQKELVYEDVIQGKRNVDSLNIKPSISLENDFVKIEFPKAFASTSVVGEIYFYRADNVKKDRTFTINLDTANIQKIESNQFVKGNYTTQVSWKYDNKNYFYEEIINIP
jgi:hypothetical protein